jgi:glycerol-3-phosphate dehydrogenase
LSGTFDLLVIGGGVNGAGIAADASARGLNVMLAEADDLAIGTSSASSKLVHGGLRYLEQFEFRLVREALAEREVLVRIAPHLVWPMRFVLPHVGGMRPAWMLRAGLFIYDRLAQRQILSASQSIAFRHDSAGIPLNPALQRGFSYSDCWVDDARLVVANAIAARQSGATVKTRSPVTALTVENGLWLATVGRAGRVAARAVVNAAGPWVTGVAQLAFGRRNTPSPKLRLVKGSHIVVPRIAGADDAYIFQAPDRRVVFALPFEVAFTLIGTTDVDYSGDPRDAAASESEVAYLLNVANAMFAKPLSRRDIVWTFAGVRPLEDDGAGDASKITRDYRLDLDRSGGPPLLNVIGGKITTYRRLAEAAVSAFAPVFPGIPPSPTAGRILPGGDLGGATFDEFVDDLARLRPNFEPAYLRRLARRYGSRVDSVLGDAARFDDLGGVVAGSLTSREIAYLKSDEWAESAHDVLWRRTKAGLHIPPDARHKAVDAIDAALARL